jgi:hypothetical protein
MESGRPVSILASRTHVVRSGMKRLERPRKMFRWFEQKLNPFPREEPVEPPNTLVAFCLHYTRGAWPYIIIAAILMSAIAITEVWMFAFLGNIVDWLSTQNRETFLQTEGWKLAVRFSDTQTLPCLRARISGVSCY